MPPADSGPMKNRAPLVCLASLLLALDLVGGAGENAA